MTSSNPPDAGDPRGTVDLVGHTVLDTSRVADVLPHNVVIRAKSTQGQWVQQVMEMIGPARATFRSTYFHWAMALNGLDVAAARYRDPKWQAEHPAFTISGVRTDRTGLAETVLLAEWPGPKAAEAHIATAPKMFAWGYIELFAALESFVFDMYRRYLTHNPGPIIHGDEFKDLRRLRREAEADPARVAEWEAAFRARLDAWHRNKLYAGLERVFLAFINTSGLKAPASYKHTTPETWSETIRALAIVRHLLVHGERLVSQDLGDLCAKPFTLSLGFKAGDPLRLELRHLQTFELFVYQLLGALNISLLEHPDAGK